MKRRPLTFTVITNEKSDSGEFVWEKTTRYSKMRHLIITRAFNKPGYAITHVMSGRSIDKQYPKLAQARKALPRLLQLTDWSQDEEAYMYDTSLQQRVKDVRWETV
jgi:hypothetical protein